MADIRIDRYEVDVASNGDTFAITDVGNLDNAFVKPIANSIKASGGNTSSTGNTGPHISGVGIQLTATNQVTFYRGNNTGNAKVMFEVWVYTGNPGGAYEFIVRQRGNLTVSNGTSGNTVAITGLTDRNQAIPVYQGFTTTESSTNDHEAVTLNCHINASNQISFSRGGNGGGTSVIPRYAVVEFTGSAWNVGHAVDSSHDTMGQSGQSVTMNTDSTGIGGSTFDVTDWATATIFERSMGGDGGGETGLADCQLVTDPGSTTTTVDIRFGDNNARNDDTIYVHILQCDDLVVNRYENNNYAENNGGASYGATITVSGANGSTPTSELSLEWSVSTTGTGTAWARGCLVAELTSSTQFRSWVHRSGNNVMVRAGIVDLSALVDSGGGPTRRLFIIS